ncbi:hypothetical protein AB1K70_14925 [Bremerella sp. JC770]|uniref:hypothetical protein n=1 Tax=Bremerella sp. JC770 TaxID=3232137 RepID=UPI0034587FE5
MNSRIRLDRSRPGLLEGLRDGVVAELGRERSVAALGRCEDCKRLRRASSDEDPRLPIDGELLELRPWLRLGVALGCDERFKIDGVLREVDGVGVDRVGRWMLRLLGDGVRDREEGEADGVRLLRLRLALGVGRERLSRALLPRSDPRELPFPLSWAWPSSGSPIKQIIKPASQTERVNMMELLLVILDLDRTRTSYRSACWPQPDVSRCRLRLTLRPDHRT